MVAVLFNTSLGQRQVSFIGYALISIELGSFTWLSCTMTSTASVHEIYYEFLMDYNDFLFKTMQEHLLTLRTLHLLRTVE